MAFVGSFSTSAYPTPLDISLTPAAPPIHHWPGDTTLYGTDFQFEDAISGSGATGWQPTINLTGIHSIQATWNAPSGYMYVVNPPPADIGNLTLEFELQYGNPGQASSLGNVTSSSVSINSIYGSPQIAGGTTINNEPNRPGLDFDARIYLTPDSQSFAFTSITITAAFDGASPSGILNANNIGQSAATFFGILYGVPTHYGTPYSGAPDPGQLLIQEPLDPSLNRIPDKSSSLILAGLGAAVVGFCKRCKCFA